MMAFGGSEESDVVVDGRVGAERETGMLLWTHNWLKVKLIRHQNVVCFLFVFFFLLLGGIFEHYSAHWPVAHVADINSKYVIGKWKDMCLGGSEYLLRRRDLECWKD